MKDGIQHLISMENSILVPFFSPIQFKAERHEITKEDY